MYENLYNNSFWDTTLSDNSEVCKPRCWICWWKGIKSTMFSYPSM